MTMLAYTCTAVSEEYNIQALGVITITHKILCLVSVTMEMYLHDAVMEG